MLLATFFVGGFRFTYGVVRRIKLILSKDDPDGKRVLIIGGGEAGAMIVKEMHKNPQIGRASCRERV